jgi:hypothetical protein
MVSKKQKDKIRNINRDLNEIHTSATESVTIMATANQQLLDDTQSILAEIQAGFFNKEFDYSRIRPLPEGFGVLWAKSWLTSRGYDTSNLKLEDLLSNEEILAIEVEVNRPLTDRLNWDRWDYIFTFAAAVFGSTADFLWGDPKKGLSRCLSNKRTLAGSWFDKIHFLHNSGSPMDYQGPKMGGSDHRLRSIGHDLFGFLEGIWQIKNGTFTGGYFDHGKWLQIVSETNQFGKSYTNMDWHKAIGYYAVHVFCDFFSSKSLPVPGFGYLVRLPYRDIRKIAHEMYSSGYNLRHFFVQGSSVGIVELIVRAFCFLRHYRNDLAKESLLLKQREMRLLAHSLVTAFNVGKVVITQNPLSLNLPQILFTIYQIWPLVIDHYRRNDQIQMVLRNLDELDDTSAEKYIETLEIHLSTDEFGNFLSEKPILL